MVLKAARALLLLLLWFVRGHYTSDNSFYDEDAEAKWADFEADIYREAPSHPNYFYGRSAPIGNTNLPASQPVSLVETQKTLFKPENRTKPMPLTVMNMLLQAAALPPTTPPVRKPIEILCYFDRMYVRLRRDLFRTNIIEDLRFGKCPMNISVDYYYYVRSLDEDCGLQKEFNVDDIIYRNKLVYNPTSLIIRDMPFEILLECRLPRFFHSYKLGFYPLIRGRTFHKVLRAELTFTLTASDELGTDKKIYTLGQLMKFKAAMPSLPSGAEGQKVYINKCFVTPSKEPNSKTKYTIIDNYGCLVDSEHSSQSMFVDGDLSSSQFVMTALLFNPGPDEQILYMHCQLALGSSTPSRLAKSCTYDFASKQWKELNGDTSVCACCETSCKREEETDNSQTVSSEPWGVDMGGHSTR